MRTLLRFLLSCVLIVFTLMPGLSAADPELRDQSLTFPLLISEYQDADTPAMIAKILEWSFPSAPVFVQFQEPDSSEKEANEAPPPAATLVPGLLLCTLRWSSDT